jgi:hypothetical protein
MTHSLNICNLIAFKVGSVLVSRLNSDWLRLVIIVGGYILLRPILVRYGARLQQQQLEKKRGKAAEEKLVKGKEGDGKAREDIKWGARARNRQQKAAERQIHDGEDSDSDDLQELLE